MFLMTVCANYGIGLRKKDDECLIDVDISPIPMR